MREIKFRIYWIHPESDSSGFDYFDVIEGWRRGDPRQEVEDIEQFTGLRDENGNDIYEGDIIKVGYMIKDDLGNVTWDEPEIYKIKWYGKDGYPAFDMSGHDYDMNGLAYIFQAGELNCEVIGNIHENPELLA